MVQTVKLDVFSSGKKETIVSDITLSAKDNCHNIKFESPKFSLNLCLKDIVDLEDFNSLLSGKEKRSILHCTLVKDGKEYKGLRKVVRKGKSLGVSLGGIRIDLPDETNSILRELVSALKSSTGI